MHVVLNSVEDFELVLPFYGQGGSNIDVENVVATREKQNLRNTKIEEEFISMRYRYLAGTQCFLVFVKLIILNMANHCCLTQTGTELEDIINNKGICL